MGKGLGAAALAAVACVVPIADAAGAGKVNVSPSSGANGTKFSISFTSPKAYKKGRIHVYALASKGGAGCAGSIDLFNTKRVKKGGVVRFSIKADKVLCRGKWTVYAQDGRTSKNLAKPGSFRLKG
jgi:hypothetical protein